MTAHLWQVHDIGNGEIFECPQKDICNYTCKQKSGLTSHLSRVHDIGDKECSICLKNVSATSDFKDPKTNEKMNGCRNCYKKIFGYSTRVEKQMVEFLKKDDRFGPYIILEDKIAKGVECSTKCRPDLLLGSPEITVFVECDEKQHKGRYEQMCEMARMDKLFDEVAGTRSVFVRWNPDYCKKDGERYNKTRDERLKSLCNLLIEILTDKRDKLVLVYYMLSYDEDNPIITDRHHKELVY